MRMKHLLAVCSLFTASVFAQECQNNMEPTVSPDEFLFFDEGTVIDTSTNLQWMRCSLGQTWNGTTCEGNASQLTWQQALQEAHGYVFINKGGWRLPNLKELATITERSCLRPSINTDLFPNTPSDDYWTSTPSVLDPDRAWVVAFFNSSNSIKDKDLFVFARLVRTAD